MVIAYVGTERCDIPYYMGRIAFSMGKSVLFVDNSNKGDLYRALTNGTGNRKDTQYGAVVRDCDVTSEEVDAYDVTILYHGQANIRKVDMPYDVMVDYLYVASEVNAIEVEDAKNALECTGVKDVPTTFIARECVTEKFTPQTMATMIGISDETCIVLPIAESDRSKYDALLNGGSQKCANVSSDMKYLLADYMKNVLEVPEKQTKKMLQKM